MWNSPLEEYERQAAALLDAFRAGENEALRLIHRCHPRFLDSEVRWLPKRLSDEEIRNAEFDTQDARLALSRSYDFRDWAALESYAGAVQDRNSEVYRFEAAVEAVVSGDLAGLEEKLAAEPGLVRARSARVTHFDPPVHGAMLLHYVAANGVENHRQRTPANAVRIAETLLKAGAEADALAALYGGQCTTMSLLVSSSHPAAAGVQVELVDLLVDYGASVEAVGEGNWTSPLGTALVFGFVDAAEALVRRGARILDLAHAAGLGREQESRRLLETAGGPARHRALALACQLGRTAIAAMLLDAGEDPDRFNPPGHHAHSTPLHQAVAAGHMEVVRLLVERGARVDIPDKFWHSTALGWAEYCGRPEIARYLKSR